MPTDRVQAIFEQVQDFSVLEISQLTRLMREIWGVNTTVAPAPTTSAMPLGDFPAPVEEQTAFNVLLTEIGPQKLQVIKAVREMTTLGLKEAKDLVEAAPKVVREGVTKEEADAAKAKLEAAGAGVVLR